MLKSTEIIFTFINGNYTWARDEFWGCTKHDMRETMLEAIATFDDADQMERFIRVIFLP